MSSLHHLPKHEQKQLLTHDSTESTQCSDEDSCAHMNGAIYGQSFECIEMCPNGSIVIASDNLSGLKLDGFVTKYASINDVPSSPILSLNPNFGGCASLVSTRNKQYICAFDSGHIMILNEDLEEQSCFIYHDDQITSLNVNKLQNKILSASMDAQMIVWDYETRSPIKVFTDAHSGCIWNADFNAIDDNMILSCSNDHNVLMWDLRMQRPASKLASIVSIPTCLCWGFKDTSHAYVGNDDGQLMLFDVRHPRCELTSRVITSNRIYRIKNVFNGNAIAICSNESQFHVFGAELLDLIYKDSQLHNNWIRDVCERDAVLYTVGRDTKLVCHTNISSTSL